MGSAVLELASILESAMNQNQPMLDLRDVKGQETAKRALEIAAAGFHSIQLLGPAGCGKTMLAERLEFLCPPSPVGLVWVDPEKPYRRALDMGQQLFAFTRALPQRDREYIDICVTLGPLHPIDASLPPIGEPSDTVAKRVVAARAIQEARQGCLNARLDGLALERHAAPEAAGRELLTKAAEAMRLSGRAYHRILRVARTIADLDDRPMVGRIHIAEALSYRPIPATSI